MVVEQCGAPDTLQGCSSLKTVMVEEKAVEEKVSCWSIDSRSPWILLLLRLPFQGAQWLSPPPPLFLLTVDSPLHLYHENLPVTRGRITSKVEVFFSFAFIQFKRFWKVFRPIFFIMTHYLIVGDSFWNIIHPNFTEL